MSTRVAPKTPGSARNNLPVELWKNILEEACRIPGKDEFGTDPRGYCDIPYDPPVLSSRITPEELQDALSTRLAVALVCKSWHSVGLPILHSHIRPRFTDSTGFLVTEYSWVFDNVQLRDRVRRVSCSIALDEPDRRSNSAGGIGPKLIFVLCLLSHPVILSAPRMVFWELPPYKRSSIVIADLAEGHRTSMLRLRTDSWENLRYLSIRLDGVLPYHPPSGSMFLPALNSLKVYVNCLGLYGLRIPCEEWHAPMLHTMSLDDEDDWGRWKRFLEKHSSTLEILNIRSYPKEVSNFPSLSLENLRELWIQSGPRSYFPSSFIHTPRLQLLVTHRWRAYKYHMGRHYCDDTLVNQLSLLERMVGSWLSAPMVPTYCISGSSFIAGKILRGTKLEEMMRALRDRGSAVTVVSESYGEPSL